MFAVRPVVSILCLVHAAPCVGLTHPQVPARVRYKRASQEVNDKARKRLLQLFRTPIKSEIPEDAFDWMAICGPFLWRKIKDLPEMRAIKKGQVVFFMPIYQGGKVVRRQKMEGKLFQDKAQIRGFWEALCKTVRRDEKFRIRRPSSLELQIYWALIPYDIEEPIFVVESDRHSFLIDFAGGKNRMFWIDDVRGATFLPSQDIGISR